MSDTPKTTTTPTNGSSHTGDRGNPAFAIGRPFFNRDSKSQEARQCNKMTISLADVRDK